MKKLKRKLRRKHRSLRWRQAVKQRLHNVERWYRKRHRRKPANFFERAQNPVLRQIKRLHAEIRDLEHKIERLEKQLEEQQHNRREAFARWANEQVGEREYGADHRKWAAELGYSTSLPWCSIFVAWGLAEKGGFKGRLPSNPAYSGAWLSWPHGHRISYSQAQPGDLLIFDWGDGGITDHVAMYAGGGQKVGGNENDRVEKDAVPVGNIVGVIRPNW